jgi:Bacterial transcriptional activator domain
VPFRVLGPVEVGVDGRRVAEHEAALLVTALFRSGRQADALAAYATTASAEVQLDCGRAPEARNAAELALGMHRESAAVPGKRRLSLFRSA